jgi:hypothetical protein
MAKFTATKVPRQCQLVLQVKWVEEKARRSEVKKVEMKSGARR